jgi:hypothetical protein
MREGLSIPEGDLTLPPPYHAAAPDGFSPDPDEPYEDEEEDSESDPDERDEDEDSGEPSSTER